MARKGIDPITLEVLWSRLIAIAEESAMEIIRTAFSTTVRETHMFAVVLLDTKGYAISHAGSAMPSFVGSMPLTIRQLLKTFPAESFQPDDLVLTNDPWLGTGHLQDVTSLAPIFYKKKHRRLHRHYIARHRHGRKAPLTRGQGHLRGRYSASAV